MMKKAKYIILILVIFQVFNIGIKLEAKSIKKDEELFVFSEYITTRENIMENQSDEEDEITKKYSDGEYTLQSPLVILNPYELSPLTALVMFETVEKVYVGVKVIGKDEYSSVEYLFEEKNNIHQIPILGLYANYENKVVLTIYDDSGEVTSEELTIYTDVLEEDMLVSVELITSEPENMVDGFTFLTANNNYPIAIDSNGEIRWVLYQINKQVLTRLSNGNLLVSVPPDYTGLYEIDLLGKIYAYYTSDNYIHHDVVELPWGNLLVTSNMTDSVEDKLVEIDRVSGEIIHEIDLNVALNKDRFNPGNEKDWLHVNSIWYDNSDHTIIVSSRYQGVFKVEYDSGKLVWITSLEEELEGIENEFLYPKDRENFKPPTSQHAAMIMPDQDDDDSTVDMMLFDNNLSSLGMPEYEDDSKYSRIVQYRIDEKNNTIEEIWSFGEELGEDYFCTAVSDADYLGNNHVIGTFGNRTNTIEERGGLNNVGNVLEVIRYSDEVLFEVEITFPDNSLLYRAERMSLYPDNWSYVFGQYNGYLKTYNTWGYQKYVTIIGADIKEVQDEAIGAITCEYNEVYKTLDINGWGIIEGVSSEKYETYIVLESDENTYEMKVDLVENQDYVKEKLEDEYEESENYYNSSFGVNIPINIIEYGLKNNRYTIGVEIREKVIVGTGVTSYKRYDYLWFENIEDDSISSDIENVVNILKIRVLIILLLCTLLYLFFDKNKKCA